MKNSISPHRKSLLAMATCLALAGPALAQTNEVSKFKISGFLSLVGGNVNGGSLDQDYAGPADANSAFVSNGVACPCYIADWSNAGIYGKDFSLTPESRIGVQMAYEVNSDFKLVGQLVSRGTNGTPDITWAYGSYKLSKSWEVQMGRKRIPLYYYSDFQDIGLSYPWVSPPPELYGWDATNYNGASIRYSTSFGDSNVTSSAFTGREDIDKSLYWKIYNIDQSKVSWTNIVGADLEINNGPFTLRGVFMNADVDTDGQAAKLTAYGVAANLDFDKWFVLSEVTTLKRKSDIEGLNYTAPAATIGVGVRFGKWTPFVNYAQYEETADDAVYAPATYRRTSATMRYDVDSNSAVKLQYDRNVDATNNLGGTVNVVRISYDRVF